jgi:serine/threonine protein kinase
MVALKIIDVDLTAENRVEAQSLVNEARLGGRLKHSGIVDTYDFGEQDGRLFVAMECIDGLPLSRILSMLKDQGRVLPPGLVIEIAHRLASALSYAHEFYDDDSQEHLGVVHRDLKPDNIMVSHSGDVKIVDFGIARSTSSLFTTAQRDLAKGTPAYMSPEQVLGDAELDGRADLFALGSVLVEMMTSQSPFVATSVAATMFAILERDLSPIIEVMDEIAPELCQVAVKLLERNRERRLPTARQATAELLCLRRQYPQPMLLSEMMDLVRQGDLGGFPRAKRDVEFAPGTFAFEAYVDGLSNPVGFVDHPIFGALDDERTPTQPDFDPNQQRPTRTNTLAVALVLLVALLGLAILMTALWLIRSDRVVADSGFSGPTVALVAPTSGARGLSGLQISDPNGYHSTPAGVEGRRIGPLRSQ